MLSFSLFFRPDMAGELAHAARQTLPEALAAESENGRLALGFAEHLRPVHGVLGAELTGLRDAILAGRGAVLGEVAVRSGRGSCQTLFRQLRRHGRAGGQALRERFAAERGHLHL